MSFGYLNKKLRTDIKLSNMAKGNSGMYSRDESNFDIRGQGRVSINVFDNMKINLHLKDYEIDRVAFEVLQKREPNYSFDTLKKAYLEGYPSRFKMFEYIFHQMELSYKLMDNLDLVNRSITMAKTYGIDLQSVETRGTQYRVESLLSRIARINKFLLLSPSQEQVWNQSLLEVIPLVMEPEKAFHSDPVSVLDFQSLYPSIIISHNICYTTCLGKLKPNENIANASTSAFGDISGKRKSLFTLTKNIKEFFGYNAEDVLTEKQEQEILDSIIVSPNLTAFVKPHIRRGLLPQMLSEILNTRIMIKKSMKIYAKGSHDYRILDSRQYALKMIANVTYGYTGAGFSGRMPCVEIADAIVSFARLSLEEAITLSEFPIPNSACHPTVIYGDTDSCFIKFPKLSLSQAYSVSQEIVAQVTAQNPYPMELKYEKIYYPMLTLAKKRY
jgi:DNA polymerase zeta